MKTRGFVVVAVFFLALAVAPAKSNAQGIYAAKLISPTAGQLVYPGQQVRVEWKTILPHVDLSQCELELYLSLDGGRTFPMCISVSFDPKATAQTASSFVIAQTAGQLY